MTVVIRQALNVKIILLLLWDIRIEHVILTITWMICRHHYYCKNL